MRRLTAICVLTLLAASAHAMSLRASIEEANRLIEEGQADAAVQLYNELQVEDPTSDVVQYNLGSAHFELAQHLAMTDPDAAHEHFEAARRAFAASVEEPAGSLGTEAAYNLANTVAQHAKMLLETGAHEEAVMEMRESIGKYEELLARHPDHEDGQINLDHMRYLYKTLRQQPPPEPEPDEQEDEQEDGEEERDGEDAPQDGEEEQQEEEQQEQEPDPEHSDDEDSESADDPGPEDTDDQNGDPDQQQPDTPEPEGPEREETIEAILQALEDLDNEEQQRMVRGDEMIGGATEWW